MKVLVFFSVASLPGVSGLLSASIKQSFKTLSPWLCRGHCSYLRFVWLTGPRCSADVKFPWEEQGKANWFAELWSPYWHLLQENLSKGKDFFLNAHWLPSCMSSLSPFLLRSITPCKTLRSLSACGGERAPSPGSLLWNTNHFYCCRVVLPQPP